MATTVLTALPLIAMVMPSPGNAAENVAASVTLDEIIVTARKREESLQDTPISVAAFSAEALENRGVSSIDGIGQFTPNLVFDAMSPRGGSSSSAAIVLRGIGQTDFVPTSEPGVGLYIDGVYLARSIGGVLDLMDIERVEVLRGPQGTLFGRNTIGGAVSITTAKPNGELSALAEVTVGRYDRIDAKGMINLPLTDNAFVKASVASLNRDGYVKRPDGVDLGDDDTLTGRLAARLLVTDDLEINISFDGTRDRENAAPFSLIRGDGAAPFPAFHNGALVGPPCVPPPGDPTAPACYNNQWAGAPFQSFGTAPAFSRLDLWGVSATIDWDLDWMRVKSITAYRDVESEFARDADHSPHLIAHLYDSFDQDQFSQELQFGGVALHDKLKWIVGLYYFKESANNVNILDFSIAKFQSGGLVDNKSHAVFVQATYDITDKLSATGGLRYTNETKKFTPVQFVISSLVGLPPGLPLLPQVEGKVSISEWTPMANLAYRWTEDFMTYVTYSEGFKSGGFTQRVFPPRNDVPSFLPEFVKVYEAGFKLSGFSNRLRLNGAAFHTKYSDLQVTVEEGVSPIVRNAAAATINGFELELSAIPVAGLLLEAGVGYLDASYDEVDPAATGITANKRLIKTPKWSLNGALSYEFSLGDQFLLRPRVDWHYVGHVENDPFNTPEIAQAGYHLVSAGVALETTDQNWSLTARVTNLTNKRYLVSGYFNPDFGAYEGVYGRPREWSLTLRYRY